MFMSADLSVRCESDVKPQINRNCQSGDIMSSLCDVGVRVNNFSKSTRPRDMLFFVDTLAIKDEKLFKA